MDKSRKQIAKEMKRNLALRKEYESLINSDGYEISLTDLSIAINIVQLSRKKGHGFHEHFMKRIKEEGA